MKNPKCCNCYGYFIYNALHIKSSASHISFDNTSNKNCLNILRVPQDLFTCNYFSPDHLF